MHGEKIGAICRGRKVEGTQTTQERKEMAKNPQDVLEKDLGNGSGCGPKLYPKRDDKK